MADRILSWYVDTIVGDGTNAGAVHCLDKDYTLHHAVVRLHAKQAPDAGVLEIDIKDDGVSIFSGRFPNLQKSRQKEEEWDDFSDTVRRMEKYSFISLDIRAPAGAKGISVSLELLEEAGGAPEHAEFAGSVRGLS